MTTDAELLQSYVDAHSEPAFAELVQRHFNVVFFAAMRQVGGDAHRARDVAQLVFVELARKASKLTNRPALVGWLYCATRFAALHVMRAERRRAHREHEVYLMQTLSPDSETAIDWERLKPVVDDVLHGLNEGDREAVLMRFFHDRPFAEIGASFGITADAARFRIDRALARMGKALSQRGIASTSTALALVLGSQAHVAPPAGLASAVALAAFGENAATAGLSTSIGVVTFMTTAKTTGSALIVLLGAVILGEAIFGWSQARDLDEVHNTLATEQAEAKSVAARLATAQAQVATMEAAQTEAARKKETGKAVASGPAPAPTRSAVSDALNRAQASAGNFSEAFTLGMDDPEFRRLLAVSQRARLNLFYSPLFSRLNLASDQLERFKSLLIDKQQAVGDANRSALALGMGQDAAYRGIATGQAAINADIRALLGESGYAQYQGYEETRGQRVVVDQLRQALAHTAAPLGEEQAAEVVQVLYRNSPPANPPTTNGVGAQVAAGLRVRDLSAPISDQNLIEVQGLLSSPQMDALRLLQQQQRERQRISRKLKQLGSANGGQ